VNAELKGLQKYAELPGGVVLVGGGAKLPGITDLAKQEMRLSAQIGGCATTSEWADEGGFFKEHLEDPAFASALGLILLGADGDFQNEGRRSSGLSFKNIFKYFAP
jgi:cell division ATPase FtsA